MNPQLTSSSEIYGISTALIDKALRNLSDDESLRRINGEANCILWIFGHLTVVRCSLAEMLGIKKDVTWKKHFLRGVKANDSSNYPHLAEVQQVWREITQKLLQRFETLTEEELSAPAPREFPVPNKTMSGAITFLAFHEAYHVGQMGYILKCLGHEGLVG